MITVRQALPDGNSTTSPADGASCNPVYVTESRLDPKKNRTSYHCCEKGFPSPSKLQQHIQKAHDGVSADAPFPITCDVSDLEKRACG